ncbi:hypothetical protein [Rhodococcus gannanensis]|uniref:Uncharacterized protein n=1 Tax=Rhodococcus gannanensis TaxID=1960308 RepID=A0ABW4P3D1_9NOCA
MQAKSLVAGVVSAVFLGATVWGASMLVSSGVTQPVFHHAPAPAAVAAELGR